MNSNSKFYSIKEATKAMERFCAYQERCHQEVILKLKSMRMIPEAIDQIVVDLIKGDFLNEARFASEYARGKFRMKKWGKIRIRRELLRREVSEYTIRTALNTILPEEYVAVFHELADRRWKALSHEKTMPKKKRKLADYLLYRGWEKHMVYDKVSALAAANPGLN